MSASGAEIQMVAGAVVGSGQSYNIPNNDLFIFEGDTSDWVYGATGYRSTLHTTTEEWSKSIVDADADGDAFVRKINPSLYGNGKIIGITLTLNDYYNTVDGTPGVGGMHRHYIYVALKTPVGQYVTLSGTSDDHTNEADGQGYKEWPASLIYNQGDFIDHTVSFDVSSLDIDYILVRSHGYTSSFQITDHGFKDMVVTVENYSKQIYMLADVVTPLPAATHHWRMDDFSNFPDPTTIVDDVVGLNFIDNGWGYDTIEYRLPAVVDYGIKLEANYNGDPRINIAVSDGNLSLENMKAISFYVSTVEWLGNLFYKNREFLIRLQDRFLEVILLDPDNLFIRQEKVNSVQMDIGGFHLVAVNFKGTGYDSGFDIYIDNVLITEDNKIIVTNGALSWSRTDASVYIGNTYYGASDYNFTMDDIRTYNSALTSGNVQELWDMK